MAGKKIVESKKTRHAVEADAINYMRENSDRNIPISEVSEAINGNVSSISSAFSRVIGTGDTPQLRKLRRGWYCWDSSAVASEVGDIMLRVTGRKEDGRMLAIDDDTNKVYVLKEVDW